MSRVLFDHPDSPNCRKVRLVLAALDLPYEERRVDLLEGGTRKEEFLRVNPRGQLPVLMEDDWVLPESNAIVVYLAERYGPHLVGADARVRAQVLRWLFWQSSGVSRPIAAISFQRLIRPALGQEPDEVKIQGELPAWRRDAEVIENYMRGRDWLVDELSVADIAVGTWFDIAARAAMLDHMPATLAWVERLRQQSFWTVAGGYQLLDGS